ncbi:bifunctional diguanylate cyclase/phosphodiesterase [Pseudoalteromonas denitrificans]|uniref:Diguanylate cyclase (GGDEF) domain-containing protein n=1 Tax=Pseudoalteromonas denitrificans DSM 6059 TaxID=1123010 RepID=A0A1I1PCU4_9GAMM|nr:EAL domain-containing protein [Pseudoalteromonas denitrificans]SFD07555.1 diguanylate cyclase (GGDEF) domain-containing protein [Pseudoalteromonas denitrificans DSM 6059]
MTETDRDDFLFLQEDEPEQEVQHCEFWDVLIVDDDPEIHSVTQLALSGVLFWDKPLRFFHAYSGKETIDFLSTHSNIAVVLLDVVMETDDAGLIAVQKIRETLNNHNIRIILRTGQPGYAPEEQVIREYDINDYKTKTELTRSKLVTSLVAAIRSYEQLCQLEVQSLGLEKVISASKSILGITDITDFSNAVVTQLADILACPALGVLCGQNEQGLLVLGGSSDYQGHIGTGIEQLDNGRAIHQIQNCLTQLKLQVTEFDVTFLLSENDQKAAVFLEIINTPTEAQLQFAEIFLTNVSVGFDNIKLFNNLRNSAFKDALTGLSNRTDFVERVALFANNSEQSNCLFLVDISQFSDINNGLGQDIGNLLLKSVVTRLQEELSSAKLLARIGADVFAIVIEKSLLEPMRLNEILNVPFRAGEHLLPINFTFGICEGQYFHSSGLQTLKSAYIALNLAKKKPQLNFEFYHPEMEEKMTWRLGIIRQLRQDFSDNKLKVWYQPQIDFKNLKMIGCEALLRWPTSDGKFISPAVFVPLAEHAGLIIDIGQWVLEQACIQQKYLESIGYKVRMAVNVSVPQFRDPNYVQQVKNTLKKYGVEPHYLELEVTESIVMDEPEVVINVLTELKEFGIEIAIDDFGTGFSSLSYLQKLPINRIKIDRAFVKDIPEKDAGAIAELIVSLGKKMNLKTIAEGIETQDQADYLINLGCDEAQGFMYSKPLPVEQLIEFVKENSIST